MKTSLLTVFFASVTADVFVPERITYEALLDGSARATVAEALTGTGLVSVTNIPGLRSLDVMASLHGCAMESKATKSHTFPDGTVRSTIATHTVPNGVQTVDHKCQKKACNDFDEAAMQFRERVQDTTQAFANLLTQAFDVDSEEPLLSTTSNFAFNTIADVVTNGEHLEHFHSYKKSTKSPEETIEVHTDQGLFLAFTPGRLVQDSKVGQLTSGFFIKTQDDQIVEVQFSDQDDLVFMLGDGVNQYVNNRLGKNLRAVPHALLLKPHSEGETRVWYGLMVLPPADAVHPSHGVTFGDLRQRMIDASLNHLEDDDAIALGCSGAQVARELSETTCEGDNIYCWHRCMNATDDGITKDTCSSQGLELLCTNPRLQISDGDEHGDFFPACADAATQEAVTELPRLPEYPRSEDMCTDEQFTEFANVSAYDNFVELTGGATFMWSVEDGEVNGKIAYNGLFGYLAFGFAGPPGSGLNGMLSALILMALPGDDFNAFDGLNLTLGANIHEYEIDSANTAFRHWSTPVGTLDSSVSTTRNAAQSLYQVDATECFTAMTFKTSSIHTRTFNITGSDELLWAANGEDSYAGYHGMARGRFAIDWTTNKASGAVVAEAGSDPSASATVKLAIAISVIAMASTSLLW